MIAFPIGAFRTIIADQRLICDERNDDGNSRCGMVAEAEGRVSLVTESLDEPHCL